MMRMSTGIWDALSGAPIPVLRDSSGAPAAIRASAEILSNNGKIITLISASESDTFRLKQILSKLGYNTIGNAATSPRNKTKKPTAFAAIVCHRGRRGHHSMSSVMAQDLTLLAERVIVLSDCSMEETVINFLNNGARHFFNIRESHLILQVRLDAALRHHQSLLHGSLTVGDIHLDRQRGRATRGGQPVKMTPKEFAFACQLFSKVGQIVFNEELLTSIWSLPAHMDTRRIDSAASLVRKKLRLVLSEGWELKRIRCVGYQLIYTSGNLLQ